MGDFHEVVFAKIRIADREKFKKGLNRGLHFIYIFTANEDFKPLREIHGHAF